MSLPPGSDHIDPWKRIFQGFRNLKLVPGGRYQVGSGRGVLWVFIHMVGICTCLSIRYIYNLAMLSGKHILCIHFFVLFGVIEGGSV